MLKISKNVFEAFMTLFVLMLVGEAIEFKVMHKYKGFVLDLNLATFESNSIVLTLSMRCTFQQ